MAGDSYLFE